MFLSNWLVFKIVLAAVTGLVDYPLAADVLLVYDNANKLYLSGGSLEYVSNVVLYKGETGYELSESLFCNEEILYASDAQASDEFGWSVSIDGDYAIVGARYEDTGGSQAGAAYIFKKSGTSWSQQQIIHASDAQTNDQFGHSVGISGDYAIVGAPYEDSGADNGGSVYIYKRNTSTGVWGSEQHITASNAGSADYFGISVSISGDYAIVGANGENSARGAVYIYTRDLSTGLWGSEQIIVASDTQVVDEFGWDVGISGDYAIVGSRNEDTGGTDAGAAYIYVRSGTTWSEQQKIQSSDIEAGDSFGGAVSIDGDYITVGANYEDENGTSAGAVYVFKRDGTTWTQQAKLLPSDGTGGDELSYGGSIDISGDTIVVGARVADPGGISNAGAAYVFQRSGTTWTEVKKIVASDAQASDNFGVSVSISGSTIITSAPNEDTKATDAGAAYIYSSQLVTNYYITQPGTYRADLQICGIDYKTNEVEVTGSVTPEKSFPSVSTKTYPSDDGTVSDSDYYGYVGLSGNGLVMVVVGKGDDDTTTNSGGFMVYEKINGVWTFTQQITNVGSGSGTLGDCDEGKSVQLDYDGTRVFIGAHADGHSYTSSGSVYIYRRVAQGNWTLEQRIDGGGASYRYGYNDVNNAGDKLIIGSYGYPGSGNTGRAWYYTRSVTTWSLQDEFVAPSTSAYGTSVGMNSAGTRAIIGGYNHSSNTGRADIWNYSGSSWSLDTTLTGENASDKFGWNVDMSNDGNTVVVGAPIYSGGGEEGRAYIYTTSDGTNWSLLKTLSNQSADERFGFSIQISGDGNTVVIGAAKNDDGVTDGGRSYVYVKTNGTWPSTPTYTIIGTTANSNNGHTLGISDTGETIISGAPFDDDKGSNQGAVYIFDKKEIASLTFDNYNKLSLTNTPTYTSSKLFLGSNVYDIGTLTSDITIEKQGEYASLTFDTSSNVAYFSNVTVGAIASTMAGYEVEQIINGFASTTVHFSSQGGFGGYIDFNGDGTRMVLGASTSFSSAQGRAYVYHLEDGSWVQKVDIPSPNTSYQRFGDSVLMNEDGTRIAVNQWTYDRIHIYEYTNGAWPTSPTTSITTSNNSGKGDMDWNKDGTVIVAGDGSESSTRKTYVYRLNGGTWTETNIGSVGHGVAINGAGTRVLIGANSVGKIYEANYDSGTSTWSSLTEVHTSSSSWPVRIRMDEDGTTAVAINGTNGQGRILERQSGTSWTSVMDVQGRCSFYGRGSGSISYDGTMVLTGDNYYNPGSVTAQGRAYLYQYSGGSWSLTKTYENPDASPATNDYWGYGTAMAKNTKDRLAIGMTGDDTAGADYGSVHIYTNAIPDFISFDTYNKLSLSGITNPTSKLHALPTGAESTTTYDIGTATNIYIESAGTYTVAMKGSDAFALDSTVVTGLNDPVYITPKLDAFALDSTVVDTVDSNPTGTYNTISNIDGTGTKLGASHTGHPISFNAAGTRVVIGEYNTHKAHVYDKVGASWTLSQTWTKSDGFGKSCVMSDDGNVVVVVENTGTNKLSLFVYENGSWVTKQNQISISGSRDTFGSGLFMSGDGLYLLATDYSYEGSGGKGRNKIFDISEYSFLERHNHGFSTTAYSWYGDIDRYGNRAIYDDGAADYWHVYKRSGASWSFSTSIAPSNTSGRGPASCDENMVRVALSDVLNSSAGVTIWYRDPSGDTFALEQTITVDNAGCNISMNYAGDRLMITDKTAGDIEIWTRSETTWTKQKTINPPTFGTMVNLAHTANKGDGYTLATVDETYDSNKGRVYIYSDPITPSLNFDTYNKLTFTGADTGSTYKLKYESNTYDLGTISNVYIAYPGTYSAEIKGATNFALSSNITGSLGTYLTLHDNVAISHTTGGGQTLVTVNNIKGNKTYKISFNKQWTDSHASYSTRLKMYIKDSSDGSIRELASIGDYLNSPRDRRQKHNPNLVDTQVRVEHLRNRYGNEHLRREYGRLFRGNRKCHRLCVDEYHGKWDDKNGRTGVCV